MLENQYALRNCEDGLLCLGVSVSVQECDFFTLCAESSNVASWIWGFFTSLHFTVGIPGLGKKKTLSAILVNHFVILTRTKCKMM